MEKILWNNSIFYRIIITYVLCCTCKAGLFQLSGALRGVQRRWGQRGSRRRRGGGGGGGGVTAGVGLIRHRDVVLKQRQIDFR